MTGAGTRQVHVVVGAAGGIGRAVVTRLLALGHVVHAADRAALTPGGSRLHRHRVDLRDRDAVTRLADDVAAEHDAVHGLVNAGGVLHRAPLEDVTDEAWAEMLDVHLSGTFRACRAFLPHLRRGAGDSGAAVVNLSSPAAVVGVPGRSAYCAAKAGIEGLTRELAVELATDAIRVNAVRPGYTLTPMLADVLDRGVASRSALEHRVPLRRLADPAEIADPIAFLLSPAARYVTGCVLDVDGGMAVDGSVPALLAPTSATR